MRGSSLRGEYLFSSLNPRTDKMFLFTLAFFFRSRGKKARSTTRQLTTKLSPFGALREISGKKKYFEKLSSISA